MKAIPNRPNILLITSDQQPWSIPGARTAEWKVSNLDRLAAQRTRFDRNLWGILDFTGLKALPLQETVLTEMEKESYRMPRINGA